LGLFNSRRYFRRHDETSCPKKRKKDENCHGEITYIRARHGAVRCEAGRSSSEIGTVWMEGGTNKLVGKGGGINLSF